MPVCSADRSTPLRTLGSLDKCIKPSGASDTCPGPESVPCMEVSLWKIVDVFDWVRFGSKIEHIQCTRTQFFACLFELDYQTQSFDWSWSGSIEGNWARFPYNLYLIMHTIVWLSLFFSWLALNEMMWTAGIQMKWVCDHRSESQFKQLRKSPKKRISGLQRDSNPWPLH